MYNRYIRNDKGSYTRIPEEDHRPPPEGRREESRPGGGRPEGKRPEGGRPEERREESRPGGGRPEPPREEPHRKEPPHHGSSRGRADGLTGLLRSFLDQAHLEGVDTGDLMLLGLLFLLSREGGADEELLAALGLLLIL